MAGAEIIGLLCAGSSRYQESVGGAGAGDQLKRAEIAGLLAGLGEESMDLALAKYADDAKSEASLFERVARWACAYAVKLEWTKSAVDMRIVALSRCAVVDVVRANRCQKCHGVGVIMAGSVKRHNFATGKSTGAGVVAGVHRPCGSCRGTGYKGLSSEAIYSAIGVDHTNYSRLWKWRYNEVYSHVANLDAEVVRTLRRADSRHDLKGV